MVQTLDPSTGGVTRAVVTLSRALIRSGHSVEIVALDEPGSPWLSQMGLTVHALGAGLTSYRYSKDLRNWLKQHGGEYDRVIVHGLWQYVGFAAWGRYAGGNIPYYVFPHGMLDPWFKRTFPFKHLKKWLYWFAAEHRVLRGACSVIFTSEEERLEARKSFCLDRCTEKISPLGVEASQSEGDAKKTFLEKYPAAKGTRVLLFLGRLHPKKGCDLLIDAFSQVQGPDDAISLVLAGPDQIGWERELRAQAARLGLANVIFTGMLEDEMKRGALAVADVFVLPSHQENFGMSVAESLSAGVPVLISNRVNIWREIESDCAGYVDSDNPVGTKRLIERWLCTPENERMAMRENARRCFTARFDIDLAATLLVRLLQEKSASA